MKTAEQRELLEKALLREWTEAFERARIARLVAPELACLCKPGVDPKALPMWMYERACIERDASQKHLEFVEDQIRKADKE